MGAHGVAAPPVADRFSFSVCHLPGVFHKRAFRAGQFEAGQGAVARDLASSDQQAT